jgi:hypothetical protein
MSRLLIEPVTPEEPGYIALKAESIAEFQHAAQAGRELAAR